LRCGFGTALISDLARVGLDADVTLDYAATGLVWGLRCKAGNIIEGSGTNPDEPPEAPVAALENATQRTILVVEDEPLLALEIVDALAAAGFHVLGPALSVSQAVDLLRQASCDAAVMDIHLGRETSELVVRMLLHRDIPMVTLSSYSPDQRPTAFDGIPGLSKPIQPKLLIAELRRCLEQPEASKRW
jgi:CheY-like chemotaxis protein